MTIPTCQSWAANAVCAALMVDINGAWFCPRCDTAPCRCEGSSGHRRIAKPHCRSALNYQEN